MYFIIANSEKYNLQILNPLIYCYPPKSVLNVNQCLRVPNILFQRESTTLRHKQGSGPYPLLQTAKGHVCLLCFCVTYLYTILSQLIDGKINSNVISIFFLIWFNLVNIKPNVDPETE